MQHGQFNERPWLRRVTIALVGFATVALLGLLALGATVLYVLYDDSPSLDFASTAWIEASSGTDTTRYQMHRDLLARHQLIGMTRAEITALLGPPTQTDKFREWDLVYWMGPEPGMGVDSVWLLLRLADERVTEHQVLTD